jgi:hypothetical protein
VTRTATHQFTLKGDKPRWRRVPVDDANRQEMESTMLRRPIIAVVCLAFVTAMSVTSCSSDDSSGDSPTMPATSTEQQIAALNESVATLEREVKGLKWFDRRIIAADPAAVIADLESDVADLQKEFTGAQTDAADASAAASEQTQATQSALDAAKKAADEAKANVSARIAERDSLITAAGAAIAEARDALDAWLAQVASSRASSS